MDAVSFNIKDGFLGMCFAPLSAKDAGLASWHGKCTAACAGKAFGAALVHVFRRRDCFLLGKVEITVKVRAWCRGHASWAQRRFAHFFRLQ